MIVYKAPYVQLPRPFEDESLLYFSHMVSAPTDVRKTVINRLIRELKSYEIWDSLDWLSLFAAHTSQVALLNVVNPNRGFSIVGAPTFTADRGYIAPSSGNYTNSGWDAVNDGVNFTQNNATIFEYVVGGTDIAQGTTDLGSVNTRLAARNGSNQLGGRANSTSGHGVGTVTTIIGLSAWDRTTSTAGAVYRDGVNKGNISTASSALTADDFHAQGINNGGGHSTNTNPLQAVVGWGAALGDEKHALLYTAVRTYLSSVGAV